MSDAPLQMLNAATVELWPERVMDANGLLPPACDDNAGWRVRDKTGGLFPARITLEGQFTWCPEVAPPTDPDAFRNAAMQRLSAEASEITTVPLDDLLACLDALQVDPAPYAARTGLSLLPEPARLSFAGFDRYGRSLWLEQETALAWTRMFAAAANDGITLEAISGFRSHRYQLGIFRRKLERGQTVDEILQVNAAPGFSEHHTGLALDISTPGEPAAEESFEATPAFDWLTANGATYGFTMSYPRDNPHCIVYEPWHWAQGHAIRAVESF